MTESNPKKTQSASAQRPASEDVVEQQHNPAPSQRPDVPQRARGSASNADDRPAGAQRETQTADDQAEEEGAPKTETPEDPAPRPTADDEGVSEGEGNAAEGDEELTGAQAAESPESPAAAPGTVASAPAGMQDPGIGSPMAPRADVFNPPAAIPAPGSTAGPETEPQR